MALSNMIYKLRTWANLSQEQFAALFSVSRQSVQKWERGAAAPELDKLVEISKHFDISLDTLVLNRDRRTLEGMSYGKDINPNYENIHSWEFYPSELVTEYTQCIEEGLDIEAYKDVFHAVSRLPKDSTKAAFGDILFDVVSKAKQKTGYKYNEPSDLDGIRSLRKEYKISARVDKANLPGKIYGGWMGRVCGCMLGKTVEGIGTKELIPLLKETGNYPMHRYICKSDITDEMCKKYTYNLATREYADAIDGMPPDDDTNYVILAQLIVDKYGRDFTPFDVSRAWLAYQPKDAYCTAERVAFCNFIRGYEPPYSAVYQNPYREWIGAQIRGDYFGYINPGNPELAAEMAWRDASISHIKNGIYGEMFVAAMLAIAAATDDIEDIIQGGLAQIPHTSRLYDAITALIADYKAGVIQQQCFESIHARYDEYNNHDWCHTISNALIVAASLLYGGGDYGRSVCMAVQAGFDTDCNAATVGSVLGMANGIDSIPEYWTKPIDDTLHTTIFGVGSVKISERAEMTLAHII